MLKIISHQARIAPLLLFRLMLLCALSGHATAEIIDDIRLKTDANGEIDAVIEFTVPVQYVRHFPVRKSTNLAIYFNIIGNVPKGLWQNYESHRSPPSDHVLGFTITTRDLNTGPKIEVHFRHPAEFTVTAGSTERSILLHIKPGLTQQKKPDGPASVPGKGAGASVVPPAIVAAPPVAPTPKVTPPVVAAPQPAVVVPQSASQAPVPPAQIGGKEGLPVFPKIDPSTPEAAGVQPDAPRTLEEQVRRANNQAAVMMLKGRDALLAGQMFAAIEAFNNVLNLPPNKYSADAQIWIGIARERSGQITKAMLEYELYLKLYPDGKETAWIKERLARLKRVQPALPVAKTEIAQAAKPTDFQTTTYGSLSMYYYHGASQTDTVATIGGVQTPTTLTQTDQSSLISNVSLTARSYNNQFDNRLVLQDFYAANFLSGQPNRNRLNAAYYDVKNRIYNYSARIGRQSALGGGVLGRFDGLSAGYGFMPNWRANLAAGRMSDYTPEAKPVFYSVGLDFGVDDPLGGSVYVINQKAGGITDRRAAGGNLRYFEQGSTAMATLDYDTQFREMNILTLQGTLHRESGTDYNLLLDRRKTPTLSIRNAVTGTTATVDTLMQNGWTQEDLLILAKSRTAISNLGMVGVTVRIREKWQLGSDITVTNISGLDASGTLIPDGTTGLEGYVAATPASGNAWTISGRVSGSDVISMRDTSMFGLSYSTSRVVHGVSLLLYNRSFIRELWTLESTLRFYRQSDNTGGKVRATSPQLKLGYLLRNNLTLEAEGGIDWTNSSPGAAPATKTTRQYFSLGFRWDF
jgi:hypothetical protein